MAPRNSKTYSIFFAPVEGIQQIVGYVDIPSDKQLNISITENRIYTNEIDDSVNTDHFVGGSTKRKNKKSKSRKLKLRKSKSRKLKLRKSRK